MKIFKNNRKNTKICQYTRHELFINWKTKLIQNLIFFHIKIAEFQSINIRNHFDSFNLECHLLAKLYQEYLDFFYDIRHRILLHGE